jgi:hypothetical protein
MRSHWRLGQDRVLVVEQEKWNKKSKQEKQTRKEQTRKGHPLSKNKGHQEKDTHFSKQEKDTHFQKTRKGHQNKKRTRKGHQEKDTHFPLRLNMGVPYRYRTAPGNLGVPYRCPVPLLSRTAGTAGCVPLGVPYRCIPYRSGCVPLGVPYRCCIPYRCRCPVPLYRSEMWVSRTGWYRTGWY